jgi:hypothetical protein
VPEACRSCRAPVFRALTVNQKTIVMDPEPVVTDKWRRGLFTIEDGVAIAWKKADPRPVGGLYQSHWGSCPDADSWRKT